MCYHVRIEDGVFWLPLDNADNERVRPIASPKRIQRALNAVKRAQKKWLEIFKPGVSASGKSLSMVT